jgi:hypothetical protein
LAIAGPKDANRSVTSGDAYCATKTAMQIAMIP